jgi:glutamate---cysteine ligase / carboxylate-amine ligase
MADELTIGVEEEFLVVDPVSGELVPRAAEILDHTDHRDLRLMGELNLCQVETDTTVCRSLEQVETELVDLRARAAAQAAEAGVALLATGTHPFSVWQDQAIDEDVGRYAEMADRYELIAREHVICGCHVHVGLPTRALEMTVMNRVRPWLPVLLALSVNSPFWQGEDSGYESYRAEVWQRWPTAGFPPAFHDRDEYDEVLEDLRRAGVIRDPKDLYWYVRPSHAHPTLEFRVCDVPLLVEDTVTIAGLVRALGWVCGYSENIPWRAQSRDLLDAGIWQAARFGTGEELLDPIDRAARPSADVVDRMLDVCRSGLDATGDRARVEDGVRKILDRGPGSVDQRREHSERSLPKVVHRLRELGGTA